MASVAALGFSIISRYSGGGVRQAQRDLAGLRAQMALFNRDMDRLGGQWGKWTAGLEGWQRALLAIAPVLVPLSAHTLALAGSLTTLGVAAAGAGGAWALALKGAVQRINDTNTGLLGLGKNLAQQKAILAEMTPGTDHYEKQLKKVNKAQDMYNHALKDADPAQRGFVQSMTKLSTAWEMFISKTQGQTLGVASKFINALADGVGKLEPLVSKVTPLANEMAKAFQHWVDTKADGWVKWFGTAGVNALTAFVTIGKNLGTTFGIMLKAFTGDADKLGNALAVGSAKLKGWAEGGGFQRFLDYVHKTAPMVVNLLKALGQWVGTVIKALDSFSDQTGRALTDVLNAIGGMDVGAIHAAAQSLLLFKSPLLWLLINCPPLREMIVSILNSLNSQTVYAMAAAFAAWRISIMLVNAGLISTPIGWVITAIGLLVVAIVYIATKTTWFQTAWTYTWNFIKTVGMAIGNWFANDFVNFFKGVADWFTGPFVNFWISVWNGIQTAAMTVWGWLTTAWNACVNGIVTAWNTVSGIFVAGWNAVWNGIQVAASTVWGWLQTGWTAVTNFFTSAWSTASSFLTASWSTSWNFIKGVGEGIWNGLKTAWSAVTSWIQTAWTTVSAWLQTAWSATWNFVKTTAETIWNGLKTAWSAVTSWFQSTWTTFSGIFQAAWSATWNFVKTTAETIWNGLKTAWTAVTNFLKSTWDTVAAALKTAWNAAWTWIKDTATKIWDGIKSAWGAVTKWIGDTWDKAGAALKKAWQSTWDSLKDIASKVWSSIKDAVEKGINSLLTPVNFLIDGFNKIASAVGLDIKIPNISVKFANGGMVGGDPTFAVGGTVNFAKGGGALNGYAPGRDTVPAILSRGEGVLTPEAVRGIGGPGMINSLNRKYAGHRGAGRGAKAFANGGMVGMLSKFAVGGLPSEIPAPDPNNPDKTSGTVGQTPGKNEGGGGSGSGISIPGFGDVAGDLLKAIAGVTGINSLVLGFIGKEALDKAILPLIDKVSANFGPVGKIFEGAAKKIGHGMLDFLIKKDEEKKKEYEAMAVAGAQSVQAWAPLVAQALKLTGAPASWLGPLLSLMQAESGGNPNAINNYDINAKNGVPSQGLMQVIPPTFLAYHQPGTSNNILDPLANIAAAINYIKARYGYVPGSPYALGTPGATSGVHLVGEQGPELVNFKGGETVTPAGQTASILAGAGTAPAMPTSSTIAGMATSAISAAGGGTPEELMAQIQAIMDAATQMATTVQASWTQVTGAGTAAQAGLAPVAAEIVAMHQQQIPAALTAMTTANTTAWTAVGTTTATQWGLMRDGTFAEANQYMATDMPAWGNQMGTAVGTAWSQMGEATSSSWQSMEQGTAEPVNWIIDNSYNNGIAAMWNAVAGVIWEGGGKELPTVAHLARGGAVHGPGTATSDSVPAMLSRGEHVWTAKEVRKAGGHAAVWRMRNGYSGGKSDMGGHKNCMGYATGGAVGDLKRGNLWPAIEGGMKSAVDSTKSRFADLLGRTAGSADITSPADWIEQYVKKDDEINKFVGGPPWIPGVSDQHVGYDGYTVNQRTADMLNAAKALGASFSLAQGSFSTGVAASAGTHDGGGVVDVVPASSGNVGFLRAVGFAAWGRGPEWGSPSFASHIHAVAMGDPTVSPAAAAQQQSFLAGGNGLADGGPDNFSGGIPAIAYKNVDPKDINQNVVSFDKGGMLPPGFSMVHNGLGRPEPLSNDLVPRGSRAAGSGDIKIEIHAHGNATGEEIAKAVTNDALPQLLVALKQHG